MIIYILATLVALLSYMLAKNHLRYSYWSKNGVKTAPTALPFVGHFLETFIKPLRWLNTDRVSIHIQIYFITYAVFV